MPSDPWSDSQHAWSRSTLGVDDIVDGGNNDQNPVAHLFLRGTDSPPFVTTGAARREKGQIHLTELGDKVQHQGHIGEKRSVKRRRHGLAVGANLRVQSPQGMG